MHFIQGFYFIFFRFKLSTTIKCLNTLALLVGAVAYNKFAKGVVLLVIKQSKIENL